MLDKGGQATMPNEVPEVANERVGPVNALAVPRFAGPDTFARLPGRDQVDNCDVALVGGPGLTSLELLGTLRGLAGMPIVGADIVEVAPAYDRAEVTTIAASHVIYELISVFGHGVAAAASVCLPGPTKWPCMLNRYMDVLGGGRLG